MTTIDKERPILVTGATGYVAGWIIKKLVKDGFIVHATVRDLNNEAKLRALKKLNATSLGEIRFFQADLLEEGSFDEAMEDCELVFHTASPFVNSVKDAQKELIDPALKGTRNVLESVERTKSVKRVVLTSSVAAVFGDTKDLLSLPNGTADEWNWNTSSSLTHQPYSYSKTVAEKEAWAMNEIQDRWDLVTINPVLVLGPGISANITSESLNLFRQLADGSMKLGAPDMDMGIVDVRDVATAHINVAFRPEAKGRHIISADRCTFLQLGQMLEKNFPDKYPFPKRKMPTFLAWLLAPAGGLKRKMVINNFGYPWLVSNKKSVDELGMNYRPVENTIVDHFLQLKESGIL